MTDIWRSFVAQACMWLNGWHLAFSGPTVFQERNEHDLLKDFEDEIPGYLYNDRIVKAFSRLQLKAGEENIFANIKHCYSILVDMGLVGFNELTLIDAWERDLSKASYLR